MWVKKINYKLEISDEDKDSLYIYNKKIQSTRFPRVIVEQIKKYNSINQRRIRVYPKVTFLSSVINNEFQKFLKSRKRLEKIEDIQLLQVTFLSKINTFSLFRAQFGIPSVPKMSQQMVDYSLPNVMSYNYYFLKYLFKRLVIVVYEDHLDDMLNYEPFLNEDKQEYSKEVHEERNNPKKIKEDLGKDFKDKILNWKPKGKLLATLYNHEEAVEKLLCLNDSQYNKFLSFGNNGRILLWKLENISNYDNSEIKPEISVKYDLLNESKCHGLNYKTACGLFNKKFAVANDLKEIDIFKVNFQLF